MFFVSVDSSKIQFVRHPPTAACCGWRLELLFVDSYSLFGRKGQRKPIAREGLGCCKISGGRVRERGRPKGSPFLGFIASPTLSVNASVEIGAVLGRNSPCPLTAGSGALA